MNEDKKIPFEVTFADKDKAKESLFRALKSLLDGYNSILEEEEGEIADMVKEGGFGVSERVAAIHFADGTTYQLQLMLQTNPEKFIPDDDANEVLNMHILG